MPQRIFLSEALREWTNAEGPFEIDAATVAEAVVELKTQFPEITRHILDEKGAIRRHVNLYVNDEDIRFLQNHETQLNDGDRITIAPAVIDARTAVAVIDVANRLKIGQKI